MTTQTIGLQFCPWNQHATVDLGVLPVASGADPRLGGHVRKGARAPAWKADRGVSARGERHFALHVIAKRSGMLPEQHASG